ncbi:MAG TPA: hypothetical protein VME67_09745 [Mycobacterium sp.]|nr:hypothetical protein [Mycobacterium sp.]HTX95092.1 hypothetical protein [Mycobacterium sp.]
MADQLETTPPRQLNAAPYYLPNLLAAIAASLGVIIGSVGPWASFAWITANGAGSAAQWWQGKTTLTLGAVAGIALFTLLNLARTRSTVRSLVPLAWIAPIAALVCFLIAVITIAIVISNSAQLPGLQVEWGLWVVAVSSAVLGVTAIVVAVQVGKVAEGSEAWTRTAIVIAALVLLGAVVFFSTRSVRQTQSGQAPSTETFTQTRTVTSQSVVSAPPAAPAPMQPVETVPPGATTCQVYPSAEFPTVARADTIPMTSCEFAEDVRQRYVNQSQRGVPVTLDAWSPVTHEWFKMTCTGNRVVTCAGGHSAVVYLY